MKKKRKNVSVNKTPPSVPKCVTKCSDGYASGYVMKNDEQIKFIFRKTGNGYSVFKTVLGKLGLVDMANDESVAPVTRSHFSNLKTLSEAITVAEDWIGKTLPDIR